MPELEPINSTDQEPNPRERGVRISTAASFIFDAEGRYQLGYAPAEPRKRPAELIQNRRGRVEASRFMDVLDLIGGPRVLMLLVGWSIMIMGGALRNLPLSVATIFIGMLIVEATLILWARSR